MIHNELSSFFDGAFPDKRIDKRANKTLQEIVQKGSTVINRCCTTITDKIGAYRMLNNDKFEESLIKQKLYENCNKHVQDNHVLCIQDTTEINYTSKIGRVKANDPNLGPVRMNSNLGFFCHPMLVVDAKSQVPLGFSYVDMWSRNKDRIDKHARKYQTLPIEDKESYRWIESAKESQESLPEGIHQTIIADRESDIYEFLSSVPNDKCDILIRSTYNRKLESDGDFMLEKMYSLPVMHTYELKVKGSHSRKNRTALMELGYDKVEIKRPNSVKGDYPPSLSLTCIYVVERTETIPHGEDPIEWRLLTTHQIESIEDAIQCIEWYKLRWYIEEVFRLLKSEGMEIEQTQLESGAALRKLTLMGLIGSWHIMTLKLALDHKEEKEPATILFTYLQIKLLNILLKKVEWKTEKQRNPYRQDSLAWAAWILGRLAGWSGYDSHGKAGYITIKRGYKDFMSKYEAFEIFRDVYKE